MIPTTVPSPPGERPARRGAGWIRFFFWLLMIVLVARLFGSGLFSDHGSDTLSYTAFRSQVAQGNVVEVTVRGERIEGVFRQPVERVSGTDTLLLNRFTSMRPAWGADGLPSLLQEHGVEVRAQPSGDGTLSLILWGLLPVLGVGLLLTVFMRGIGGRARSLLSLGRSGARRYVPEGPATTFDDVAGAAGAKRELQEIVTFLTDPGRFHRLGAEVPKGVLLVGPPGTGKTLLARAVAGEADVAFFSITGSDFMEMFVGVGAKRVRDLFGEAKAAAPSIVFIDELDSIGRHRGAGLGGGHDEREQTLNQLLSELDGFQPAENVIVMAATNRPDILDPALLRPGRFDRRIAVDLPTAGERLEILRLHARELPLHPDVDLEPVAAATPGFSGADLKNLLNEAALAAARSNRDRIGASHIEAARDRILLGLERAGLALSDDELTLLAYHESGHALLGVVLPNADPVHKATIVPRGRALGSTHQIPQHERVVWRLDELMDRLAAILGGRAAERLVFDTVSSGAEDDLARATRLARRMVLRWGMSPTLGPLSLEWGDEPVFLGESLGRSRQHSEATAEIVDAEVRQLLDQAAGHALDVLQAHRDALDALAQLLLRDEEISGAEIRAMMEGIGPGADPDAEAPQPAPGEPGGSVPDPSRGGRRPRRAASIPGT